MATLDPVPADRPSNSEEALLVARARAGEIGAIEEIVRGHQAWIYNLAVRMLQHRFDAEDATQEILVKALTRLSSFEGRSSFRTWLYRLAVNHVLNTKRGRRERETVTFQCYGHGLDATPDLDPPDEGSAPADVRLLVDEARLRCTSGMLLCLDREQRVIYILGEIFGLTDGVGAELLDISRDTFRQRLARARRDLHSFMNDKCGLVNPANPCRCARKTRGFIQAGYVDPRNLLFARAHVRQVREVVQTRAEALSALDRQCGEIYRQHPFSESLDLVPAVRRLLESPAFHRATEVAPPPVPSVASSAPSPP